MVKDSVAYSVQEKSDRRLHTKISTDEHQPLYSILPTAKKSPRPIKRYRKHMIAIEFTLVWKLLTTDVMSA